MIKVNIVCVGKIKEQFYRDAVAEYVKRLSRFCRAEICELSEGRNLEEEGEAILRRVRGYVIALCVEGQKLSSTGLAARIKQLCDGGKEITFIIGSSCGLAATVSNRANFKLSMSKMTFLHQFARLLLVEQIYRAFKILKNETYHK